MAEELQGNDTPKEEPMDVAVGIETKIHNAMRSRISHFKEQAEWAFSFSQFLLIPITVIPLCGLVKLVF